MPHVSDYIDTQKPKPKSPPAPNPVLKTAVREQKRPGREKQDLFRNRNKPTRFLLHVLSVASYVVSKFRRR